MKKLLTAIFLGLTMSLSITAMAEDHATLRVVQVETDDVAAYVARLTEGKKLIKAADEKFTIRAWQATFAGDATGVVIVGVDYPGSFGEFAMAWENLIADPAVGAWLGGLSELRSISSDSLYNEFAL